MPTPYQSSPTSPVSLTQDRNIDALLGGIKWGGPTGTSAALTFSFPQWTTTGTPVFAGAHGRPYSDLNEPTAATVDGLNTSQQASFREAMTRWAAVADLSFQELTETPTTAGDLRIAFTSAAPHGGGAAWGWAGYPDQWFPAGGDIWVSAASNGAYFRPSWAAGGEDFTALLHEIGHALGFKHPFEDGVTLIGEPNTLRYTVMAYNPAPNAVYFDGSSYAYVRPDAPMLLDIAAAQYQYGANTTHRAGDDTYTFDPGTPFFRTLWDAGGNDTISVANFTTDNRIDLRAGNFSDIKIPSKLTAWGAVAPLATYDGTQNLAIAYGATIENAIGGSGRDYLIGNAGANRLQGGRGDDAIEGFEGIDTAVYVGRRSEFTMTRGTDIIVEGGSEGRDILARVERLEFSDGALALDLDGNAGLVARILGVTFGRDAVLDQAIVAIGLRYADSGMEPTQLMKLALDNSPIGPNPTNASFVQKVYQNVVGSAPAPEAAEYYVGLLQRGTYTHTTLAMLAADTAENAASIDLVGLTANGLAYAVA